MKRITTFILTFSLLFALSSCKTKTNAEWKTGFLNILGYTAYGRDYAVVIAEAEGLENYFLTWKYVYDREDVSKEMHHVTLLTFVLEDQVKHYLAWYVEDITDIHWRELKL